MDNIINSPLLWAICSITVLIIAYQAFAYYRLSRKQAVAVGVSRETSNQALRIGMVTSIGPAFGILIVMVGLMAVLGNPLTWMRLSMIVSATNEIAAAQLGAEASGVTLGGPGFGEEALFVSWFGMWLNGVGSLMAVVFFAKYLKNIQTKVVAKNPRILAVVAGAAMCAIYGNLSSSTVLQGTDFLAAWAAGGLSTFLFYKISQKHEKLKEYSLGLAMIVGTVVGALFQAFL